MKTSTISSTQRTVPLCSKHLITTSVGFLDEVVACVIASHRVIVGVELEGAVDRTKIAVGEGGLGQSIDTKKLRTSL